MTSGAQLTFVGMAHPWMCDTMGHVNVRHYMGFFDDASFQFLALIAPSEADGRFGWADARCEIDYRREIEPGTPLAIHTHATRIGGRSITYAHRLVGSVDRILRAEAKTVTARFDLVERKAVELDEEIRRCATMYLVQET